MLWRILVYPVIGMMSLVGLMSCFMLLTMEWIQPEIGATLDSRIKEEVRIIEREAMIRQRALEQERWVDQNAEYIQAVLDRRIVLIEQTGKEWPLIP